MLQQHWCEKFNILRLFVMNLIHVKRRRGTTKASHRCGSRKVLIQLTKAIGGQQGTLKCVRDDGTSTWQPSTAYFAFHDLIHFAVETVLGYTEAFYGVVAAGKGLDEFGSRQGQKDLYTCQEAWAESIVGLLQWPGVSGGIDLTEGEFFEQLNAIFANHKCNAPDVTIVQLRKIRRTMSDLHEQWNLVPPGDTMEITFSP